MPQMGVSVSEGTITKWLKQEGEYVAADESLLEISTDKVDTEVPSPGEGVLQQILVQEGETVAVGTKLAVIAPEGAEAAAPAAEEPPPEPATQAAADESMAAASEGVGDVAPAARPEPAEAATTNGKSFVSPVVARIASEHGVDPNQVEGLIIADRLSRDADVIDKIQSLKPQGMLANDWSGLLAQAAVNWRDYFEVLIGRGGDDERLRSLAASLELPAPQLTAVEPETPSAAA